MDRLETYIQNFINNPLTLDNEINVYELNYAHFGYENIQELIFDI